MPMGYDSGGGGTGGSLPDYSNTWDQIVDAGQQTWDEVTDWIDDAVEAIWRWVKHWRRYWVWVRELVQEIYYVDFEAWHTANDERTCPVCMGKNGAAWEIGEGDYPPAHNNCRCSRFYAYSEARTRLVWQWVRELRTETWYEWEITGWA